MKPAQRFHRGRDGWGRDSYRVPSTALVGTSYCGDAPDSPAPLKEIKPEIDRFRKEVLRPRKIPSRIRYTRSGNLFMVKRWLCVPADKWAEVVPAAKQWLEDNNFSTRYIHDADLPANI